MRCPRTESAIETCDRHVARSGADPEVEVILAQHVASVAYAEFEGQVRSVIQGRCSRHADDPLSSFAGVAALRLVRSIKITELSGALGWFGDAQKQRFNEAMRRDREAAAAWNNILTGRHTLAHEQSSTPTLTLGDVKRDVARSTRVLDAFEAAIAS